MLAWLKQRRDHRRTARALYGSIVTQSRLPHFYARWGVPDTREGRFEMLALHLVLVLRRIAALTDDQGLQRALTERFVVDIDDALREMTVGDLAVPRHVKLAVAVLHDRHRLYGRALELPPPALADAISARLGALDGAGGLETERICAYLTEAVRTLDRLGEELLLAGHLAWPTPTDEAFDAPSAAG